MVTTLIASHRTTTRIQEVAQEVAEFAQISTWSNACEAPRGDLRNREKENNGSHNLVCQTWRNFSHFHGLLKSIEKERMEQTLMAWLSNVFLILNYQDCCLNLPFILIIKLTPNVSEDQSQDMKSQLLFMRTRNLILQKARQNGSGKLSGI